MEKLLTVTIPSYNAEKTLKTCLDSLKDPAFLEALDVVIINDGSKDRTAEIGEAYAREYPGTFRLVNKENGGHGSGINRGIREAKGLYFKVLDADDWFDRKGLTELLGFIGSRVSEISGFPAASASDSASGSASAPVSVSDSSSVSLPDLISSQFLWALDNGSGKPETFQKKAQFDRPFEGVNYQQIYALDDVAEHLYVKFHNLTVRTELLRENSIRLDEHCYYEDTEYALYPFAFAKTIAFTETPVYMYRIGISGQSMSREKLLKNVKNYDLVMGSLLEFYDAHTGAVPAEPTAESAAENEAGCSPAPVLSAPVRHYFENFIARCHAGRIKIGLNMPAGKEAKEELLKLEQNLRERYPEIYGANRNTAVKLLRRSDYALYGLAARLAQKRGTI